MSITEKYELMDRYNAGELSGAELEVFTKMLNDDPEFAQEVKLSQRMDVFFQKKMEIVEMREMLEEIYKETILKKKKPLSLHNIKFKIHRVKLLYKIAAGIIFIIGISSLLYLSLRPPENERLYSQYFKVYDASGIVRGNNSTNQDKIHMALMAYDNEDYKTSYKLLNVICSSEPDNMEAFFYKGLSAMENQNFDDAVLSLNTVVKNTTTLYNDEAIWYLALSYLGKDDLPNARITLQKIIDSLNNVKKEQAVSLLHELE